MSQNFTSKVVYASSWVADIKTLFIIHTSHASVYPHRSRKTILGGLYWGLIFLVKGILTSFSILTVFSIINFLIIVSFKFGDITNSERQSNLVAVL